MLPEGARRAPNQGLEGSGALLGAMWAQRDRQERLKSLLVAARGPEGETKINRTSLGRSWAALGFIFQPPQGPRRLPQGLPEGLSESFWELFF